MMTEQDDEETVDFAADQPEGAAQDTPPDIPPDTVGGEAAGIRNPKILDLPVRIIVSVGNAHLTVQELLDLTPESVVDLDASIDDPAELYVGDRLIARGALVEAGEEETGIGVRIVEICNSVS